MPFFCAVPPALPPSPEGVRTFPGAGPYTIREYRPNQRIVLGRNRYYGGRRAHHVDGFHVDLGAESPDEKIKRVATGRADWTYTLSAVALQPDLGLIDKFGLNYSRFFITPGLTISMYVFNSSGPLFRNNPQLRRAVNLALDRGRLLQPPGAGDATDQYLPPNVTWLQAAHDLPGSRPRPRTSAGGRESPRRQGRSSTFPTSRSRAAPLRGSSSSCCGARARDRDPAVRGTRDRVVLPRAARQRRRAVGPGARALDARLRRSRRVHQPPARRTARRRHEPCPLRRATVQRPDAAGVAPARRGSRQGLRRAGSATRPRRRAARADRRPQRGDARLGTRRACMLRRPGLVLTTVCLKR